MIKLEDIRKPVSREMKEFDSRFKSVVSSNIPLLNIVTRFVLRKKGKQMRPLFVFLSSGLAGNISEATYTAASLVELMHTATLVHDDVVDESNKRRGFFSINALWKNKIAVLVGDYLFSKGLLLSLDNGDFDLLRIISVAVREMSEGELLQIEKARRLDIDEEIYYDIIRQKTATLIAACCSMGACSVKPKSEEVEIFRKFGEYCGMAFQIKDDLFDYGEQKIGKPTGIDIKEQKMTLPLIYVLNTCSKSEKKWLINSVKNHNRDKKRVKEVIEFVINRGGLTYAETKMNEFKKQALDVLATYPQSQYRDSLELMVNYVVDRKK